MKTSFIKFLLSIIGLKKGSKLIVLQAGFKYSAKDSTINIGELNKFYYDKDFIGFGVDLYGYDLSEENHINGFYNFGTYTIKQILMMKMATYWLRFIYSLDENLPREYFYNSERMLKSLG
jgi:hypothetical protein